MYTFLTNFIILFSVYFVNNSSKMQFILMFLGSRLPTKTSKQSHLFESIDFKCLQALFFVFTIKLYHQHIKSPITLQFSISHKILLLYLVCVFCFFPIYSALNFIYLYVFQEQTHLIPWQKRNNNEKRVAPPFPVSLFSLSS